MNDAKKNSPASCTNENGCLRVRILGEIDHHTAKTIRDRIDEQIFANRPKSLYMNFSDVDFMDSSGLGLIMGRYKLMNVYGGKTYIEDPSHRVLQIIELAGMNRIVEVVYTDKKVSCEEENAASAAERTIQ